MSECDHCGYTGKKKYGDEEQLEAGKAHDPPVPLSATGQLNLLTFDAAGRSTIPKLSLAAELEILEISFKVGGGSKNVGQPTESAKVLINKLLAHYKLPSIEECKASGRTEALTRPLKKCRTPTIKKMPKKISQNLHAIFLRIFFQKIFSEN